MTEPTTVSPGPDLLPAAVRPLLVISRLCKRFGDTVAVDDVTLSVSSGEILCLLGPSGCGKTTLLRLIAGLETADSGTIAFAGRDMAKVPVHLRSFGFMFQDYALFPHKNVAQNVAFGLRMAGLDRELIQQQVQQALSLVGLVGKDERTVEALSGGEQQRVALARSLAPRPRLLLLDEPLGSLDRALRERLMNELRTILKQVGVTAITVTHDQQEAFALADRILVMEAGRALQTGTPEEVYRRPACGAVARFLGLTNLLEGSVAQIKPLLVETAIGRLPIPAPTAPASGDGPVSVLIRPEAASICGTESAVSVEGTLTGRSFRGGHYQVELEHPSGLRLSFALRASPADLPSIGEAVRLQLDPAAISLLPGVGPSGSAAAEVTVSKLDAQGNLVLSYPGRVLSRTPTSLTLQATYSARQVVVGKVTLRPGDRFVEHYYTDRWYNIFEIYDGRDGCLKAWYCNVTRPAEISAAAVSAHDLALDLLVPPEGQAAVLDRDEFEALVLHPDEKAAALSALQLLQDLAREGKLPRTLGEHQD